MADRSRQVVRDLVEADGQFAPNALVRVGRSRSEMAAATRVTVSGEVVEVRVAPSIDPAEGPVIADDSQRAERVKVLVDACRSGVHIEAVFDDGTRSRIVGVARFGTDTGQTTHWQLLVPVQRPGAFVAGPD